MTATKTVSAVDGRQRPRGVPARGLFGRDCGHGPGDTYGRHAHGYHKVLFCLDGSITFHLDEGDVELEPGDRLDIEPGTEHGATVGPNGCSCVEASR
jgi:quercetin dioxygenase-like cupin family protein